MEDKEVEAQNADKWCIVILHSEEEYDIATGVRDSLQTLGQNIGRQVTVEIFADLYDLGKLTISVFDDIAENASIIMFFRTESFFSDFMNKFGVDIGLEDRLVHEERRRRYTVVPLDIEKKTKIRGKVTVNALCGLTVTEKGDIKDRNKETKIRKLLDKARGANGYKKGLEQPVAGVSRQVKEVSSPVPSPPGDDTPVATCHCTTDNKVPAETGLSGSQSVAERTATSSRPPNPIQKASQDVEQDPPERSHASHVETVFPSLSSDSGIGDTTITNSSDGELRKIMDGLRETSLTPPPSLNFQEISSNTVQQCPQNPPSLNATTSLERQESSILSEDFMSCVQALPPDDDSMMKMTQQDNSMKGLHNLDSGEEDLRPGDRHDHHDFVTSRVCHPHHTAETSPVHGQQPRQSHGEPARLRDRHQYEFAQQGLLGEAPQAGFPDLRSLGVEEHPGLLAAHFSANTEATDSGKGSTISTQPETWQEEGRGLDSPTNNFAK